MSALHLQRISTKRRLKSRRAGGTLLEVLISLVIVLLIVQAILQTSAQRRVAARLAKDEHLGLQCAMQWQTARNHQDSWAQGEEGSMPDVALAWKLLDAPSKANDSTINPDDSWQVLELRRTYESAPFWRVAVRLDEALQEPTDPALRLAGPIPAPAGNANQK